MQPLIQFKRTTSLLLIPLLLCLLLGFAQSASSRPSAARRLFLRPTRLREHKPSSALQLAAPTQPLVSSASSPPTGVDNVGDRVGERSFHNTIGEKNTATVGERSLATQTATLTRPPYPRPHNNTDGSGNTVIGIDALYSNHNRPRNTANGNPAALSQHSRQRQHGRMAGGRSKTLHGFEHGRTVVVRSFAGQPAPVTRPTVFRPSIAIQPARPTRPAMVLRSLRIPPATSTLPWALTLVATLPPAITISISATWVVRPSPIPFALEGSAEV